MAAPRSTAAHASVVFLKIPEFAQSPVAEQVRLKDRLEGAVAGALAGADEAARIVLEAPDGAAVVVLGNPPAALKIARRSSAGASVGLSHGPVRVAEGGTTPIVLGDGLFAADAVAGFATPGRIAATREFRDALARVSPSEAWRLAPAGVHSDARDRSYEVFLADEQAATTRRRRLAVAVGAGIAVILAAGVAARIGLRGTARPAAVVSAPPAVVVSAPPAHSGKAEGPRPEESAKPSAPPAPSLPAAPLALATLRLDIRPQGEVIVDGVVKGKSPPLVSLQIAPGKHRIEVRRAGSSTLVLQVDAGPGEHLSIKHAFAPPPPKSAWRRFFDQFK